MRFLLLLLVLELGYASNECKWLTDHSQCTDASAPNMCVEGACQKDCSNSGGVKPCPQRAKKYVQYTYLGCEQNQAEEDCHSQLFVQDLTTANKDWLPLTAEEHSNFIRNIKYVKEDLLVGHDKQYVMKINPSGGKCEVKGGDAACDHHTWAECEAKGCRWVPPAWAIIGRSFQHIRHVSVLHPNHVYVVATEYKMQDKNGRKDSVFHYNIETGELIRNYWSSIFEKTGVDGVHLVAPIHDEQFAILERVVSLNSHDSMETGMVNIFVCDVDTIDAADADDPYCSISVAGYCDVKTEKCGVDVWRDRTDGWRWRYRGDLPSDCNESTCGAQNWRSGCTVETDKKFRGEQVDGCLEWACTASNGIWKVDKTEKTYLKEACSFRARLTNTYPVDMEYSPETKSLYILSYDASAQPARNPEAAHTDRNHVQRLDLKKDQHAPDCYYDLGADQGTKDAYCSGQSDEHTDDCTGKDKAACTVKSLCQPINGATVDCMGRLKAQWTQVDRDLACRNGVDKATGAPLLTAADGLCAFVAKAQDKCNWNCGSTEVPFPTGVHIISGDNSKNHFSDTFYDMGFEVGYKRIYMIGGQHIPSVVNIFDLEGSFLGHEEHKDPSSVLEPSFFPFHACYDYPATNYVAVATGNAAVPMADADTTWPYTREPITEQLNKDDNYSTLACAQIEHEKNGLKAWHEAQTHEFNGKCKYLAEKNIEKSDKKCFDLITKDATKTQTDTHYANTVATFKDKTKHDFSTDTGEKELEAILASYFSVTAADLTINMDTLKEENGEVTVAVAIKGSQEASQAVCNLADSARPHCDTKGTACSTERLGQFGGEGCTKETCTGKFTAANEKLSFTECKVTDAPAVPLTEQANNEGTVVVLVIVFVLLGILVAGGTWWWCRKKNSDSDIKYGKREFGVQGQPNEVATMNTNDQMYEGPDANTVGGRLPVDSENQTLTSALSGGDNEPIVVTAL